MTTNYYNTHIESINSQIETINQELSNLPTGELAVYQNRKRYYRYFYYDGTSKQYLSSKEKTLAQKLTYKKYLTLKKNYLESKITAINSYTDLTQDSLKELNFFLSNKGYLSLLKQVDCIKETPFSNWQKEKYNTNPNFIEQLTYACPSGNHVRSKSEVFIDMVLYQHNIPYRYEAELKLGNHSYYPDFTIMHPLTNEIIYWEHFGMMDEPEYRRKAYNKLSYYGAHNIIPGNNLIATFESKKNPFSFSQAEATLTQMNL